MTRGTLRLTAAATALVACVSARHFVVSAGQAPPQTKKPNIIFVLADDLGYADVGFNGSTDIKTPNIDTLAASGARLTHQYVQPVCSPTRASLMTGRYPMRVGLQVGVVRPWSQFGLPLDERTLPQALKEAGYSTALIGKWHLGHFDRRYLPTARGFDVQYGSYNGAVDYYTHLRDGGLDWHRNDRGVKEEGYVTHLLAKEAVRYLQNVDTSKPFFLDLAFTAPHEPLQAPESYQEPYASAIPPRKIYAGMIASFDEAMGQVMAALDARGLRDNTLIVFASDNGGWLPGIVSNNGPLRDGKASVYEGGVRSAAFVTWKGHVKAGTTIDQPMHMVDWYPTLLKIAGATLEQPLAIDGKDVWPTITANKPSPHDAILLNTTPTSGAIRMGDWKLVVNGHQIGEEGQRNLKGPPRGRVAGATEQAEATLDQSLLRPYMGLRPRPPAPPADGIELFNLATDPYEKDNVAAKFPGKVKELRARYDAYAAQAVPPKAEKQWPQEFPVPRVWGEPESSAATPPGGAPQR